MNVSVSVVGVVGAGFMGSGIAESAAAAGLHVIVHEPESAPLERSREHLESSVAKAVRRGRLSDGEAADLVERIVYTTRLEDLAAADLVVEAIVEDPKVKGELFARLDQALPD